jgi:hypothetical protein
MDRMPMKLMDLARIVRSKNAGPLHVTIDLMFPDEQSYAIANQSSALSRESIAALYGVPRATVAVIPFAAALAIKVVLDRPVVAGSPGDRDVYGAQQHLSMLELDL